MSFYNNLLNNKPKLLIKIENMTIKKYSIHPSSFQKKQVLERVPKFGIFHI